MQAIFKNSKCLSKGTAQNEVFRGSGILESDVKICDSDRSGINPVPLTDTPEEKRLWKKVHDNHLLLSSGPAVNKLTTKFIDEFVEELDRVPKG